MRRALGLVLILGWSIAAFGAASPDLPFHLHRDTIVDPGSGVAYTARPNQTIEAFDLTTGRTIWTSTEAALPIGLAGTFLIGQIDGPAGHLEIRVLDAATGRKLSSATIPLPFGATASVGDGLGAQFRATAQRDDSFVRVSWTSSWTFVSGAFSDDPVPPVIFVGSALIDPATGNVYRVDSGPASNLPSQPFEPLEAGGVSASLAGGHDGPLTLKRTDIATGVPLPDILLSARALEAFGSVELVVETVKQATFSDPGYRWLIFKTDTGERVTDLRSDLAYVPFFVFGGSLIVEWPPYGHLVSGVWVNVPLQIYGLQLATADVKWNLEIRDTNYNGPYPPVSFGPAPPPATTQKRSVRR